MSVYRALVSCPRCQDTQEVWNNNGKVVPTDLVICHTCNGMYDSNTSLVGFLVLRSNSYISTSDIRTSINN